MRFLDYYHHVMTRENEILILHTQVGDVEAYTPLGPQEGASLSNWTALWLENYIRSPDEVLSGEIIF
jgi:hypothetical protein